MRILNQKWIIVFSLILVMAGKGPAQTIDLSDAQIVCFEKTDKHILKALTVLQEEVEKRSGILLPVVKKWSREGQMVIVVGIEEETERFPDEYQKVLSQLPSIKSEGYKIVASEKQNAVLIAGNDARGVLYGIGKLLRTMEMRDGQILLPGDLATASSPAYPIRGHQLGYRPKTNSYDAWSVSQFDQYIRDLAVFAANSIEIMPPRTDDDFSSVHMQLPAIKMIAEQSKICDSYGMDVWMWYPNMGKDYSHPDSLKKEMDERHEVFKAVPRLDALFVPGGDPGDVEPDILFDWLAKEAEILHQYHPHAKIWVSPQVFRPTPKWFDAFYQHVNREYPWFGGVVFGPWIKTPIEEIRKIVNPGIPIRRYPDITHSLSCQYPIPNWDLAYAVSLGRECINPRPTDQKMIHNAFDEFAQGSISYSEGTNDDVNKIIWSGQDWDPETPVIETLREYARYFIGPDFTEPVAQGMLALERNIQGPLLINNGVTTTLRQWQEMERNASPKVTGNFRFQMGLIRAYCDAYIYRRLIYETELEQKATELLAHAHKSGSQTAITQAKEILLNSGKIQVWTELRDRCIGLADSLFKSIGAQLTVEKHAAAAGRGNFIDNIDVPLNNAVWLMNNLASIEKIKDEKQRLEEIDKILQRNNPGPGGFYDNFGSPLSWAKVKSHTTRPKDPGNLLTPRVSFGIGLQGQEWVHEVTASGFDGQACPIEWMSQATTLYDQPLEIEYDYLDPKSSYIIRVAYTGRFRSKMKMAADDIPVHDYIQTGIQPVYEFPVPEEALKDGKVTFKWTCGEGERGAQVAEIWIIKKTIK
jgi:hypothetical protein